LIIPFSLKRITRQVPVVVLLIIVATGGELSSKLSSSELHIEATLSIKRQNNPGIKISFFIMFGI
jgi:hypothetical protein